MLKLSQIIGENASHNLTDVEELQSLITEKKSYLNFSTEQIPDLPPPDFKSHNQKKDLDVVKNCVLKPTLHNKFLDLSHEKSEAVFEKYCNENGLSYDKKLLKKLNKQLSQVVGSLKQKYSRPRPKVYMEMTNDEFPYSKIKDTESFSYPSGHTAHGYFIAGLLSAMHPSHSNDFRTLAELIGQSRIDNGVHYPSDVEFGRYVGELAAQSCLNNNYSYDMIMSSADKKHSEINESFRNAADGVNMNHSLFNNQNEQYVHDLAEFIRRSNEIELYTVSYDDCFDAAQLFLQGFPGEYCSDNQYIQSHLNALTEAAKLKPVDNLYKIQNVHKALGPHVLERGEPGMLRNFSHMSRSGVQYPEPSEIIDYIGKFTGINDIPFVRHVFYEWVHPFCDGNGRSGRIILAAECDFDFERVNKMIDNNYLNNVIFISNKIAQGFLR